MGEEVPIIIGSAGLTGRQQIVRDSELEVETDDEGRAILPPPKQVGKAMPPNCRRVLSSPLSIDRGGGCSTDCPGRQRDGGCLLDVVRAAEAQGIDWSFEIVNDGLTLWWDFVGDAPRPIPVEPIVEAPPFFICPHCGKRNEQSLSSFHYWCTGCGKNAKDE